MGELKENDLNEITRISKDVEKNSSYIDDIVDEITGVFLKDLDACVGRIQQRLFDNNTPPTDSELDEFCLTLSTMIYFAGEGAERIGVRDGMAKTAYKEAYNTHRLAFSVGTAVDRTNAAELKSLKENVVSMAYGSAYKTAKAKVDAATELLASIKKVLSRRMDEMKLSQMSK